MRREFFSGPCLCGTARIEPRLWLKIPENARSVGEIGGNLLGDRKRASEARRLDAEEVDDARKPVLRRPLDHEIGRRLSRTGELRPDPAIVGHERIVRQSWPIVADALVERGRAAGVD